MDTGEKPHPAMVFIAPKMNMREMKLKIIICPATIFAKRRMINAAGFIMKTPAISTGTKITFTRKGTPGGQKICLQKWPVVLKRITINDIKPNTMVNAILPVTLAEPGNIPKRLLIKIKKNTVSR